MLAADKQLKDYVSEFKGFYMRYSDDFIIIIPKETEDFSIHYKKIKEILDSVPNLKLEDSKTNIFHFDNLSIKNCSKDFIAKEDKDKNILEFLGFAFDGKNVRLRDKTISKFYNRLYRKLRTIVNDKGITHNKNRISCKNLYQRYSYKGSRQYLERKAKKLNLKITQEELRGNFLDYVSRSQRKFKNDPIKTATKRHMQKIRKKLNTIPK